MKIVNFDPGILDLVLYSALYKNVTYIVDCSGFKRQLWSFFNFYSILHTAEMWNTSYIF